MRSAIALSCVWFYQEIARRIGNTSMQYWIDKTSYGNKIMGGDSTEEYTLHSKTGWGSRVNPQIGWYVGYIEKANNTWIFALNIDQKQIRFEV